MERIISDDLFSKRAERFPDLTPRDKEQYWYRDIFSKHFPGQAATFTVPYAKSIACSTEKVITDLL